ncbi:MAG TPA: 3-dehydroquinate synthase [Spirochaetota bacterium]|nr:3-dehydroquinate synthase [Spirochaetota bacterium]OPZ35578.1 MAG: 3-dehydroquinate synthase [Spirochaetes bacterium ADurb.BinA120]HPI15864.1 3-dehydroquinate synthase [Spirochaetota bacterium]HPO46032.1 3-dehydroquinate synthase [Spirochaetota bacterium]HPV96634.1 3-dehydroquinate synthase [Spirochaetota bacterium]
MDGTVKRVRVKTSGGSYDVVVGPGALRHAPEMRDLLGRDVCAMIVNETVQGLHGAYIRSCFEGLGEFRTHIMPDGEEYKSFPQAERAFDWMLASGISRRSTVVGIGGGVTGDFSGFLAALFMRGIPIIHVPTTLLAMVDSSVGGKVAVNISAGKNIIGAFHQPALVVADIDFLGTLPDNELRNGLAEALKHAFIGENALFELFEKGDFDSIRKAESLMEIVYRSALFKSSVVERDEREGGLRAILNFGHTVGHAVESLLEYRGISHGQAVALGMAAELEISVRAGLLDRAHARRCTELLERYGLRIRRAGLDVDGLMAHMKYDKKTSLGRARFALLSGPGKPVYDREVLDDVVRAVLADTIVTGG